MNDHVDCLLQIGGGDAKLVARLAKHTRRHVVADTEERDPGIWPPGTVFHYLDGPSIPGPKDRFGAVVLDSVMRSRWHKEAMRVLVPGGVLLDVDDDGRLMEVERKPLPHVTVVACYTEDTSYEQEAKLLIQSLDAIGMSHDVRGYPDGGDWYANTALKADFIRDIRDELGGPLLFLDVDQYVHENCERYFLDLAVQGVDFAAHWFAGPAKGHDTTDVCGCVTGGACTKPHRMISSCLFLGDTDGCRELLANWTALNDLWRERGIMQGGGQKNLWYTLTCMPGLKQARLPGRFCYVYDKPWAYPPDEPCIIEHTIASREHRDRQRVDTKRQKRISELSQEGEQ